MSSLDYIRNIFMLCLSVVGCAGNLLTLIVVNQRFFRKTASAAFISGLCLADGIVLSLHSIQIVAKFRPQVTSYDCTIFFFLDVFRLLSVWIVCVINIERCSLVFNPCRMVRLTSATKSRLFVVILFLISLIIFSHYALHMEINYSYDASQGNVTGSYCAYAPDFHRFAWECIKSALTYWCTIPVCIVCNCIIVKRLYQASRIERTLNNDLANKLVLSSKQRQLTAMLVASSIWFVLTAAPATIHSIYLTISENWSYSQYIIHTLVIILLHSHHASNFLIFALSCARFRMELVGIFRKAFHCEFYAKWYKRSTPNTEQVILYSNKQQRQPMKLLLTKSTARRQSNHKRIVILGTNNYHQRYARNYGHCSPMNYNEARL